MLLARKAQAFPHLLNVLCAEVHELEGGSKQDRTHGKPGAPIRLHGKQRRWQTTFLRHVSLEGRGYGSKCVDAEGAALVANKDLYGPFAININGPRGVPERTLMTCNQSVECFVG